jgi:CRP/FNR family cyclic AMP-dependent transcriptional regulator
MSLIEAIGWLAALLTLATYSMKTMVPLRLTAVGSSLCFIAFGWFSEIPQMYVLHLLLLPFNLFRLAEIFANTRRLRAARRDAADFSWLAKLTRPTRYAAGEMVFCKGDRPDNLYSLDRGEVLLEEIDVTLRDGDIFGEIAFFTEAKERTVSARCIGECRIVAIDEARFMSLFYQNPAFGFAVVQLISNRLMEGIETRPDAYVAIRNRTMPRPEA